MTVNNNPDEKRLFAAYKWMQQNYTPFFERIDARDIYWIIELMFFLFVTHPEQLRVEDERD